MTHSPVETLIETVRQGVPLKERRVFYQTKIQDANLDGLLPVNLPHGEDLAQRIDHIAHRGAMDMRAHLSSLDWGLLCQFSLSDYLATAQLLDLIDSRSYPPTWEQAKIFENYLPNEHRIRGMGSFLRLTSWMAPMKPEEIRRTSNALDVLGQNGTEIRLRTDLSGKRSVEVIYL